MENRKLESVLLENVGLIFRNFAGSKTDMNAEGDRNFHVVLPEDIALAMIEDGWTNIKAKTSDMYPDELQYRMKVKVNYSGDVKRDPMIFMVTPLKDGRLKKKLIQPDDLWSLDVAHVTTANLEINPSNWTARVPNPDGTYNTGVTAYLRKGYIHIFQSRLDAMYEDAIDDDAPIDAFEEE